MRCPRPSCVDGVPVARSDPARSGRPCPASSGRPCCRAPDAEVAAEPIIVRVAVGDVAAVVGAAGAVRASRTSSRSSARSCCPLSALSMSMRALVALGVVAGVVRVGAPSGYAGCRCRDWRSACPCCRRRRRCRSRSQGGVCFSIHWSGIVNGLTQVIAFAGDGLGGRGRADVGRRDAEVPRDQRRDRIAALDASR